MPSQRRSDLSVAGLAGRVARILDTRCGIAHHFATRPSGELVCVICPKHQAPDRMTCLCCDSFGRIWARLSVRASPEQMLEGRLCRPCAIELLTQGGLRGVELAALDLRP